MLKLILIAVLILIAAILYFVAGMYVCLFVYGINFSIAHSELERENFQKGIPIKEHVKMVNKKLLEEEGILFNPFVNIIFWPPYLVYIYFKKHELKRFLDALSKINGF